MKLWKTLKLSGGGNKNTNDVDTLSSAFTASNRTVDHFDSEDVQLRHCSESPDSGLPVDKSPRRIIIQLDKHYDDNLGFILAGRPEPGASPTIIGFKNDSSVRDMDRFAPGDKICSVNGISTARLSNEEVLSLLENVEERASLEVEYYMPNCDSQNSLCINTKVTQINVEKIDGSFGMTLRGGELSRCSSDESTKSYGLGTTISSGPFVISYVRPGGPVYATGRIKSGDRLVKVDNICLSNKTLSETYKILQNSPKMTVLTIEYDVSVMESVKYATGPLLVEIERAANESLGLILTDKNYAIADNDPQFGENINAFYIESIVSASISDRCGALRPGDRVLAVNDLLLENVSYTPEEVMHYMDNYVGYGFIKLQVYPIHTLVKQYRLYKMRNKSSTSPIFGLATLNSRKSHRQNKQIRQSSLPKGFEQDMEITHNNFVTGVGVCRSEILSLQLDILPNCDSGITVSEEGNALIISHIANQSSAYKAGCLQLGDRVLTINSVKNLTAQMANDVLQSCNNTNTTYCLNLKIEFDMADNIEASSGIFNVKLAKTGAGLGVTITGNKQSIAASEEPMVISNIKIGSVAYRNGTLTVGDQIIAIDSQPLSNISLEEAFDILQNFPSDIITLTIRKSNKINDWNNFRGLSINRCYGETQSLSGNDSSNYKNIYPFSKDEYRSEYHDNEVQNGNLDENLQNGYYILDLELMKRNNESLGLTIAGSEDASQPIIVSSLVKDGIAEKSRSIQIGDQILFINNENVQNRPLSEAIKILQNSLEKVTFKLLRNAKSMKKITSNGVMKVEVESPQSCNLDKINLNRDLWDKTSDKCDESNNEGSCKRTDMYTDATAIDTRMSYLATDENKLLASNYKTMQSRHDLPLPDCNFMNALKSLKNDLDTDIDVRGDNVNHRLDGKNHLAFDEFQENNLVPNDDNRNVVGNISTVSSFSNSNSAVSQDDRDLIFTERKQYNGEKKYSTQNNHQPQSNDYQIDSCAIYESEILGLYNIESMSNRGTIHHVTLYKDVIYDDYGFSVSDGLYERGVYINRIRKGGPADIVGLLRPYDRILQVNGTRTVDFDCCLTVPLIASAGDRIELVLQRLKDTNSWCEDNNSSILENGVITKTI